MVDTPAYPKHIFGLHEPGGEWLMSEKGKSGWILFTHALGHDPADQSAHDYRPWADRGFGAIARLNHGYGDAGTLPLPAFYDAFAQRVGSFVANSPGCHVWVIGNEPNHEQERPEGQLITPAQYAQCYRRCYQQIHALPGHDQDQVVLAPVAPWNATTPYAGNQSGNWVRYFLDMIREIYALNCPIDAIALHTYTHGTNPALVSSEAKMDVPFQQYRFQFRAYRDFMEVIPSEMRHLPVYITETDQVEPWANANSGWVQNAYREINAWNNTLGRQQIRALILYRWPRTDQWYIQGKHGIYDDMRAAMEQDYTWRPMPAPREVNGHILQGGFLDFYERISLQWIGQPISDEIVEGEIRTQYFEKMILQQDPSGAVTLVKAGVEVMELQGQVAELQDQCALLEERVQYLSDRIEELEVQEPAPSAPASDPTPIPAPDAEPIIEIARPLWENVVYQLRRHATKRYTQRDLEGIQYLTITHSAVSPDVTVEQIAAFHVTQMDWPGIGYHFLVDADGAVAKTNELSTVCYHVQERDPLSIAIGVAGDFTESVPTEAQLQATAHLIAWLLQELDLPLEAVVGKCELVDTQSPGQQWLSGQKWKERLLAEVAEAQVAQRIAHLPLPLFHYVLSARPESGRAWEEWMGTQAYISRFGATHGFSTSEAELAHYVTVVGDTAGIDEETEGELIVAGCRVERIAGRTADETVAILQSMATRGQRFLSLVEI